MSLSYILLCCFSSLFLLSYKYFSDPPPPVAKCCYSLYRRIFLRGKARLYSLKMFIGRGMPNHTWWLARKDDANLAKLWASKLFFRFVNERTLLKMSSSSSNFCNDCTIPSQVAFLDIFNHDFAARSNQQVLNL